MRNHQWSSSFHPLATKVGLFSNYEDGYPTGSNLSDIWMSHGENHGLLIIDGWAFLLTKYVQVQAVWEPNFSSSLEAVGNKIWVPALMKKFNNPYIATLKNGTILRNATFCYQIDTFYIATF